MKQHNTQINNNLQETKSHGKIDYPLEIYNSKFSSFHYESIGCHWHQEIEIILCLEGKMEFQINDKNYLLEKDTAVFVNSNRLHSANIIENSSSTWLALVFDTKIIYGFDNSIIKTKYVDPITLSKNINGLYISNPEITNLIKDINSSYHSHNQDADINISILLLNLWKLTFNKLVNTNELSNVNNLNSIRIKKMLDYIHLNYSDKFSIDDLAKHISLCKSECQRFFKKEIGLSIMDYVIKYRIEKSLSLLLSKKLLIKEISDIVGFNSPAYYSETFKKYFNITPKEYLKKENKH